MSDLETCPTCGYRSTSKMIRGLDENDQSTASLVDVRVSCPNCGSVRQYDGTLSSSGFFSGLVTKLVELRPSETDLATLLSILQAPDARDRTPADVANDVIERVPNLAPFVAEWRNWEVKRWLRYIALIVSAVLSVIKAVRDGDIVEAIKAGGSVLSAAEILGDGEKMGREKQQQRNKLKAARRRRRGK